MVHLQAALLRDPTKQLSNKPYRTVQLFAGAT